MSSKGQEMLQQNEGLMQELMAEIDLLKTKIAQLEQQQNNLLPITQPIQFTSGRRLIKRELLTSGGPIEVYGSSNTGIGVYGKSNYWIGVRGDSNSIGGYFYGGKASLWLTSGQPGIPTDGSHSKGEIVASKESNGTTDLYFCTEGDNTDVGTWIRLNEPYTAGSNIAISSRHEDGTFTISATSNIVFLNSPVRVAASQKAGGKLTLLTSDGSGEPETTFQAIKINPKIVPAHAKGLLGTLSSVGATSAGNLRLWAFGSPLPAADTLNILPRPDGTGFDLTTPFTLGLGLEGKVNLGYSSEIAGSTCGFAIDVVAYVL